MEQCDNCKSENLEVIEKEGKTRWDMYYMDYDYFEVWTIKCKDCGHEFIMCP